MAKFGRPSDSGGGIFGPPLVNRKRPGAGGAGTGGRFTPVAEAAKLKELKRKEPPPGFKPLKVGGGGGAPGPAPQPKPQPTPQPRPPQQPQFAMGGFQSRPVAPQPQPRPPMPQPQQPQFATGGFMPQPQQPMPQQQPPMFQPQPQFQPPQQPQPFFGGGGGGFGFPQQQQQYTQPAQPQQMGMIPAFNQFMNQQQAQIPQQYPQTPFVPWGYQGGFG